MQKTFLPDFYSPSETEEYMNPLQIEYFRQKLIEWKSALLKESNETIENLQKENWNESDITDRTSVELNTRIELRTKDRYRKLLNKIELALT
jgi:DnaK suppressor protein